MKKITFCAATLMAAVFANQPTFAADKDRADPALDKTNRGADQPVDRAAHKTDTLTNRAGKDAAVPAAAREGAAAVPAAAREGATADAAAEGTKDRKFVMKATQGGLYEVQAAKIAQERSQSDTVKQLAQMIERDHQRANQQLMQLAQSKGFDVPKELDAVHQAKLQELQKQQGQDFDKMYLYDQVAGHVKMSLKFRDASTQLQDPDLKQYAATTLQAINQHGQHAARAAGWTGFGGEAMPASSHERGAGSSSSGHGSTPGTTGGQSSGATSGGQGPVGPGGSGDTGSTPRNK